MATKSLKFKHQLLGGHVHVRVFSINEAGNSAKLGDLTMDENDWRIMKGVLVYGMEPSQRIEIEDEGLPTFEGPLHQPESLHDRVVAAIKNPGRLDD